MIFRVLIVLLLNTGIAQAESILVTSGDHGEFTRLAFEFDTNRGWSIDHANRSIIVGFPSEVKEFLVDSVFSRIGRTKIESVSKKGNKFLVNLACDCEFKTANVNGTHLVLDVFMSKQPEVNPNLVERQVVDLVGSGANSSQASAEYLREREARQIPKSPNPRPAERQYPSANFPTDNLWTSMNSRNPSVSLLPFQEQLLVNIGSATSQGLLNQSKKAVRSSVSLTESKGGAERNLVVDSLADMTDSDEESTQQAYQRITPTESEVPVSRVLEFASFDTECPRQEYIAIHTWGQIDQFSERIAMERRNLSHEFDRFDLEAQMQLARTYIYFGFGAEAIQTLSSISEMSGELRIMKSVAHVLEYGTIDDDGDLSQFFHCEGDILLWAFLSNDEYETSTDEFSVDENGATIVRAFSNLPQALKEILALEVSHRFSRIGKLHFASQILRSAGKNIDQPSPEIVTHKTSNHVSSARLDSGFYNLQEILHMNNHAAPTALIRYVELAFHENRMLTKETTSLLEAYAFELQDTPLKNDLRRAHILSLAAAGQFEEAFANLKENNSLEETMAANTLADIVGNLTSTGNDVQFLEHVLELSTEQFSEFSSKLRFDIIARLTSVGFLHEALAFSENNATGNGIAIQVPALNVREGGLNIRNDPSAGNISNFKLNSREPRNAVVPSSSTVDLSLRAESSEYANNQSDVTLRSGPLPTGPSSQSNDTPSASYSSLAAVSELLSKSTNLAKELSVTE